MNANHFVTVYSVTDVNKAELIRVELQSLGVSCRLDGHNQAGLCNILEIGIMVPAKDADRARKFILQHEERGATTS